MSIRSKPEDATTRTCCFFNGLRTGNAGCGEAETLEARGVEGIESGPGANLDDNTHRPGGQRIRVRAGSYAARKLF
jgi:hypothetical protein